MSVNKNDDKPPQSHSVQVHGNIFWHRQYSRMLPLCSCTNVQDYDIHLSFHFLQELQDSTIKNNGRKRVLHHVWGINAEQIWLHSELGIPSLESCDVLNARFLSCFNPADLGFALHEWYLNYILCYCETVDINCCK